MVGEKEVKDVITKMFASGELQIDVRVSHVEESQIRFTVYISDEENTVLQSSSDFIKIE